MKPETHLARISELANFARNQIISGVPTKGALEEFTFALDAEMANMVDDLNGNGWYFLQANRASLDLGLNDVEEEN